MRNFLSTTAQTGQVCCMTTMALLFALMQFSFSHAQARPAEKSASSTKGLGSEHVRLPRWLADTLVRLALFSAGRA